ncbi:RNA polymerase sigma factor [Hyunsoonleella sp. 2307UL5-6]|uniref:RNA polymerase sigma factor n=1 Tax=Hyunsoonleella sp. 2307UL5-6 TaxID=3384768 RepID=UPI0039BC9BA9
MSESNTSTEALKDKVIKGDYASLEKLYRIYFDKLRLYGNKLSSKENKHTVEDTIQELFIWIAKNTQKLAAIDNFEAYLFSAFKRNRIHELHHKKNKQISKNKYLMQFDSMDTRIEGSVETSYIEKETKNATQQQVSKLMNQLSPAQREVLYLRHFVDLNYKTIAKIMELNEQVVRNYAYRAMQKLRNLDNNSNRFNNKKAD